MQIVRVGRDGRFALPAAPPGRSVLVVADPHGRSAIREIDVAAGGTTDAGEIALEPPATVRGAVRTPSGDAVPDVAVWWEPAETYHEVFFLPRPERARADASGGFALPVWTRGPVVLYAESTFTIAPEGTPEAGQRIPLGPPARAVYRAGDGPVTLVTRGR
jgi:hypothetical protein